MVSQELNKACRSRHRSPCRSTPDDAIDQSVISGGQLNLAGTIEEPAPADV